ncbi:MAG: DUF493 domain-containing protein [Calditrichaeota bacterium]|nr:MAG: DUF493 domain-containing protein [Calditrichota bacterium]
MRRIKEFDDSLEISYPCVWQYKIIGNNADVLRDSVENVINTEKFMLSVSNKSSKGKFVSYNLAVTVESNEHRLELFDRLKKIKEVKMIL